MNRIKIFHACDMHGSEVIWKKILKTSIHYGVNVIMMCGDLTGKAIVPIIKREGEWYYALGDRKGTIHTQSELEKVKHSIREKGYYVIEVTPKELEELKSSKAKEHELFVNLMKTTLTEWLNMVNDSVPKDVTVVVNPGNDDFFEVDEIIKQHERVIYPLKRVIEIGDYSMISCEYVNPTPWNTPRELPESELRKALEREFEKVKNSERLICNFHAPPYDTHLDMAPKLDKNWKPVTHFGAPVMEHVGSKAVKDFIMDHQPLIGLHGHIHESCAYQKLGRTLCLNPGSEYRFGILRGYVIELPSSPGEEINFWRVEV